MLPPYFKIWNPVIFKKNALLCICKGQGVYILMWMGYLALVAPLCLAISLAKGTLEDNLRIRLDKLISLARNGEICM